MKKKILIIEDDKSIAAIMGFLFRGEGWEVVSVFSGEEGLKRLSRESPDLIILDVNLPGLNGFEVCQLIKNRSSTRKIPIIFHTVRDPTEGFEQGLSGGAAEYLMKPTESEELLAAVRKYLSPGASREKRPGQ